MPFRVSEIQPTPNPNAAKFILDREISEHSLSFLNPSAGLGHPIAERLFEIPGVRSLLLLGDFITINKSPEARWDDITGRVRDVLKAV
jgi:hypothetical protein